MIVIINTYDGIGSTGKICSQLKLTYEKCGKDTLMVCSHKEISKYESYYLQTKNGYMINNLKSRILGNEGLVAKKETEKLIKYLKTLKVDLIHLHNIHGHFIHFPTLFNYIKENDIPVIWTLHDCWPFTGHCSYFDYQKCDKWKTGCYKCPIYKDYPQSIIDTSKKMYEIKKKTFTGVKNMIIVTPSLWLKNLVKQSYLKEYEVKVIHNGIDLSLFKPTESNFRKQYNLGNKYILLGVAFDWGLRKGLDIFIKLSKMLNDNYKIVLIGTDDKVDEKLPKNILSIHRTTNQQELVEIYSTSNLFINPTREDNFPTVNLESLACGTPVITFKTGGSPESLNEKCGRVVNKEDIDILKNVIIECCEKDLLKSEDCISQSKNYEANAQYLKYNELCDDLIKNSQRRG